MKTKLTVLIGLFFLSVALQSQNITLNLKAFLEGPFSVSQMQANINPAYIPLSQPYNIAPWNYSGAEQVISVPNADVVDWVLVELRETAGNASTAYSDNAIARQAGFILKDGTVTSVDGASAMQFAVTINYNLYVVLYYRNHISVMSSSALTGAGNVYTHDFTAAATQAYGGSVAHKEIVPGIWGMISGDGNADGQVSNADIALVWKPQVGLSGYLAGDYNVNGQVDNADKVTLWKPNTGSSAQIPGSWYCGLPIVDIRDGQMYNTILIGTQCWMAQDLNVGTMIPGTTAMTDNSILEKYCYNDDPAYCDEYGALYQWNEAMQYSIVPGAQGICPDGWHVPTDPEWTVLTDFLGGIDGAAGKMKEVGTTHWLPPNAGTTNSSGFTALGAGYRDMTTGAFGQLMSHNRVWSSTGGNPGNALKRTMNNVDIKIYPDSGNKNFGFSTRCLMDVNQAPEVPSNPEPASGATNQPIDSQISWVCTDPENDPLTYDVYFGTSNPPSLASAGQTASTYDPGMLSYNTTYYWKIVAFDDHGNSNENPVWSFTTIIAPWQCGQPMIDARDNQSYNTVLIGTQCWMAQDLNIGTMIPGTTAMTDNSIIEKYCYNDDLAFCDEYGALYQWNEAMQYSSTPGVQGICPAGWHFPTDEEWTDLTDFLGGIDGAAGQMKEVGTTHWLPPNAGTTNSSGFTALGAGYRDQTTGAFAQLLSHNRIWSSTTGNPGYAKKRTMNNVDIKIYPDAGNKNFGFSTRCVMD